MFNHIMSPVDLTHIDQLSRALDVTADMAKRYDAKVTFVSATNVTPGEVAHSPEEFRQKLADFAKQQGEKYGFDAESKAMILHDKTADLDDALVDAVDDLGADLVVMASHTPNMADHFWSSNGGSVARHSKVSVMIVRGQ
ncbi:Nucleotide-binding universal stress protein, UspA family [Tranquillimonas rosea]|uniref:Nucleotide-binding universal stress protein, UspA family n=1 Tax=Tranquillimonas rosea TaxID=641238 RepID=A0A1H9VWC6_9RHOB|nr:universal stress protein [Tranquillimonas rosea]SES25677.1 Nucleotide-binding universal stress protein, UspA family [Tranquillimonas rosea]